MASSLFWRLVAVIGCFGLLYVGHGLHRAESIGVPSLDSTAHASGVAIHGYDRGKVKIYTTDPSGQALFIWEHTVVGEVPHFVGRVDRNGFDQADIPQRSAPRRTFSPEVPEPNDEPPGPPPKKTVPAVPTPPRASESKK